MRTFAHRSDITARVLASYRAGFGTKTIARETGVAHSCVRRLLISLGEYQPGKLKRLAIPAREKWEMAVKRVLRATSRRWRKCIKKKAPKQPRLIETEAQRYNRRYHTDRHFNAQEKLYKRVNKIINRGSRYGVKHLNWLGCTPMEFLKHIASQWTEGMGWHNYGNKQGQWSIDHIRPCSTFNLAIEAQALECFHFSNMRPLWHRDNMMRRYVETGPKIGVT